MLAEYTGNVVFASDYPHGDGTFPGSTSALLETTAIPGEDVRRILRDNALNLYGVIAP
jgi:predicted TIM-barrel fold metal-dependent hydrolase